MQQCVECSTDSLME